MKAKAFFSYLLLFALLASCPALSASAEEAGRYEMTCSATNTGFKVQLRHQWYDSMDQLWSELDPTPGPFRLTEIKLYADWDVYEEKTLDIYNCRVVLDLNGHSIIRHTNNDRQVSNGGVFRIGQSGCSGSSGQYGRKNEDCNLLDPLCFHEYPLTNQMNPQTALQYTHLPLSPHGHREAEASLHIPVFSVTAEAGHRRHVDSSAAAAREGRFRSRCGI